MWWTCIVSRKARALVVSNAPFRGKNVEKCEKCGKELRFQYPRNKKFDRVICSNCYGQELRAY